MNRLEFLDEDRLQVCFRRSKKQLSCMDEPLIRQLRHHDLIPEEGYKKVIRMKNKDKMRTGVCELLDWIEAEQLQKIRLFWTCVFENTTQNPTLQELCDSLLDGTFRLSENGDHESEGLSDVEDLEKTRGTRGKRVSGHSSSQSTPSKKKKLVKPIYGSLQKGEKAELWKWPIYKNHLPVTCGDQQGSLYRIKLAKGEPCILSDKKWYTPPQFEKLSGKHCYKNWKQSIRCRDATLKKLLKDGHLKCPGFNRKAKRSLFPCSSHTVSVISDSEEEEEGGEEEEKEVQANPDEEEVSQEDEVEEQGNDTKSSDTDQGDHLEGVTEGRPSVAQKVFRVTCGGLTGMLHRSRFASGRRGKSIRTEDRWLSPVKFTEAGSAAAPHARWRRDIKWEQKPLSHLIKLEVLQFHSELCSCQLCQPDPKALEDQKNDDECFVCWGDAASDLVMCDHCPRSFHPECHLSRVDPSTLDDDSPWMCTFCIWNMTEHPSQITYEDMLMCPVSVYMLQCHYLLLSLYNADKDHILAKDPCVHVSGYSSHTDAMWLDKVTEQLLNQKYNTVRQFLNDIRLIFSNYGQFNQNDAQSWDMGVTLKDFYEREVEKCFPHSTAEHRDVPTA